VQFSGRTPSALRLPGWLYPVFRAADFRLRRIIMREYYRAFPPTLEPKPLTEEQLVEMFRKALMAGSI
jgi:hypothetical protein